MRFFLGPIIIFLSIVFTLAAPITSSHRSRDLSNANAESLALVKRGGGEGSKSAGSRWKGAIGAVVAFGRGGNQNQGPQRLPIDLNANTKNPIPNGVNTNPTPFNLPPAPAPRIGTPAAAGLVLNVNPAVLAAGAAAQAGRGGQGQPPSPASATAGSPNLNKPLPNLPPNALQVTNKSPPSSPVRSATSPPSPVRRGSKGK